jgi:hypothetical protein
MLVPGELDPPKRFAEGFFWAKMFVLGLDCVFEVLKMLVLGLGCMGKSKS